MGDLRIVGTDADHLLLVDGDDVGGTGHRVGIDAVREALRQAAHAGESKLTPREIQEQLRLGVEADQVAQLAGVSVERIRRWEGPVLAERAHALERAQRTRFARPPDGAVSGPLGRLVDQRLAQAGVLASWDAYRDPNGGWIVAATHDHATARWGYDGSSLTALDPHAEALGWREPPRAIDPVRGRSRARTAIPSWEAIMENAPPPNAFPT
jgi:hypothetical protein